jgi:hypothetical protein
MKNNILYVLLCACAVFWNNVMIAQTNSDASATGISRAFNPAISVNALFSGMGSDRSIPLWEESGPSIGLHCQAVDIEITSNVDVYLQSKVVFGASENEGLGLEEAYLTSLRMPIPMLLRGGMMLNTFGRYNLFHLHHMAFAENPLILNQIFGPKLREVGLEASYLLPLGWYSEMLAGVLNGNNRLLFDSNEAKQLAYLFHFDNFWEFSDETALRLGCSYLYGDKGLQYAEDIPFDSTISKITSRTWGIDFHLKWKPLRYGRYRSLVIEGEYVNTTLNIDGQVTNPLHGYYVQSLYQFGLRWWLQGRYEWFNRAHELHYYFYSPAEINIDSSKDFTGNRISIALAYVPTEFSAYRLQYNRLQFAKHKEQQLILQVNVTIGSHPAHKY